MTIFVSIVGLGVLVFVHELGHFIASLVLGMRPRRFYVGFPPAVWKTTRNGIEYGLGAIPLGGFVKIPGMHRPAPVDVDAGVGRVLAGEPEFGGGLARLRGALGAGDHEAARDAVANVRQLLEEADLEPQAKAAAVKYLEDIDDALGPTAYWRAATWKRVAVIAAGPVANVLLALILFTGLFMTSEGKATTRIEQVVAGMPAQEAGLRPGDRVVSIDGTRVEASDITRLISGSEGKPVTLVVERGGRQVTLPSTRPELNDGAYRLGFILKGTGLPVHQAAWEAVELSWRVTEETGRALARLVTGEGRNDITSPVGIVEGSSDAAKEGTTSFLAVLALISLSLALLNMLPLLPLDGGHVVFAVVEGIRGRAVRRQLYERVSAIGIGIVLILFIVGLSNDIGRLS